ncbi:MAG TPA: PAS domain S-box protein [Gemmatimonadales bacterium]|nr:PAS domain S-box protein [Gemmatimonadales bacterium]
MPLSAAVPALIAFAALGLGWVLGRRSRVGAAGDAAVSERRFRAILGNALDAVISMDGAGRITGWNGQAEAIFGWREHEVLGRTLAETIVPPVHREAHLRGLARFLATGEANVLGRRIEITALRRDGSEFPVELAITVTRTGPAPEFSGFVRDISESRRATEALRERQAYLDGLFEGAPEAIVITDERDRVVRVNGEFTRLFGYRLEEIRGRDLDELVVPEERRGEGKSFAERLLSGDQVSEETVRRHRDGREIPVSVLGFPVRVAEGRHGTYAIYRDISARLRLEDELLQARKMESIGRLAGGVAHDFNNILTAILGYLEAARTDLAAGLRPDADLEQVERAARRAAELTRRLLGFARQQIAKPRVVDLERLARSMENLLGRLLGADVHLTIALGPALGRVRVDPGQLEQVLVNLAINARDAMPGGGRLTIEARNLALGPDTLPPGQELCPGDYVELLVRDTGNGMDPETVLRAFEPFYTTKKAGSGTGLGLATCYGIIKQSGGHITVASAPGRGTTFRILLPHVSQSPEPEPGEAAALPAAGGSETVLVVEDEPQVRVLLQRLLAQQGYRVLAAADGDEALALSRAHPGAIQLLVTDVVLPRMNGREVARRLDADRPGLPVLYVSGHTEDAIVDRGVLESGLDFLPKPYTRTEVLRRVREALDRAR